MSDDALHREKILAEVRNLNEEAKKFTEKARKFGCERWWHAAFVGAALVGATASATLLLLRLLGLI